MPQNVMVALLGFPGVGKLTIAQALAPMLDARVVDNHWSNNPILGLLDDDGLTTLPDSVWVQTAKVRDAVLETIATLCSPLASFIFTSSGIHGHPGSHATYHILSTTADRRSALFVPIRLLCAEAELVRRVTAPERRKRLKSIDSQAARLRSRAASVIDIPHPHCLSLDVTGLTAEGSARAIHVHIEEIALQRAVGTV